jgi:hypothetical protein
MGVALEPADDYEVVMYRVKNTKLDTVYFLSCDNIWMFLMMSMTLMIS